MRAKRTVTVSGLVGSGKTTVAHLLIEFMRSRGIEVELGEMPELDRKRLSRPLVNQPPKVTAPWWPVRVEVGQEGLRERSKVHAGSGDRVFEVDGDRYLVDGEVVDKDAYEKEYEKVRRQQLNDGLFSHLEKTWLPRLMRYGASMDGFVERPDVDGGKDDRRRYRIYTNDHCYVISAVVKAYGDTYLGCVSSTRKPRAGEKHTRGNDLPDGKFDYDTWLRIVHAIVAYELVPLERSEPRIEDEEPVEQVSQE